ncbi:hypothetical protein NDU88_003979 [Pleurodeles waltl]|uniref:Gypsy retrotransposon integrase-like protein 1 n=1 Tax=Pleurodeles waltl TaxID=8319 RepID=A0AAV7T6J9_PLEWA|nr:hypothetical protein NDU88_003979 [Pleurodeles waltl]
MRHGCGPVDQADQGGLGGHDLLLAARSGVICNAATRRHGPPGGDGMWLLEAGWGRLLEKMLGPHPTPRTHTGNRSWETPELVEREDAETTNEDAASWKNETLPGSGLAGTLEDDPGKPNGKATTLQEKRGLSRYWERVDLVDSGCSQSVIRQDLVSPKQTMSQAHVLIACVHGDQSYYPVAMITFQFRGEEEPLRVGVLPHLEEDIIIGTDYTAFTQLLNKAGEEHTMRKWWDEIPQDTVMADTRSLKLYLSRRQKRNQRHLHWEENCGNKEEAEVTRKVYTVASDYRRRKREDPTLKNAWEKALSNESTGAGPSFLIHNDLLHRKPQAGDNSLRQLVVPHSHRIQVLQVAHGGAGEGHLGRDKTEEAILKRFYWPGICGEIRNFCQSCQKCQLYNPVSHPTAPLQPLPIIQ